MNAHTKTPTPRQGQASYDSVIEWDSRKYTIDAALHHALADLYGSGIALRGRGQWQRFKPPGKSDLDGYASILGHEAALIGRWDTGEQHLVILADEGATDEDRRQARERARAEAQQARERQREALARQHAQAAERARHLWSQAAQPQGHAYLAAKQVDAGLTRQLDHLLLVPLTDGHRLVNLQTITIDGTKRFLRGGRKKGCYHPMGDITGTKPLLICEGWATGMSLFMATGYPVACAMDAGNLLPVARSLRDRHPGVSIIICADNDRHTDGNPGVTAGKAAACVVGGTCIWPQFPAGAKGSDFNDLALLGKEVRV